MKYFQQGDVLLYVSKIPKNICFFETNNPILQYGEHTGHKHALQFMHDAAHGSIPAFKVLTNKESGVRYLRLEEPANLVHEEHKTILLQPGEYEIGIVREYDHFKEEARKVID